MSTLGKDRGKTWEREIAKLYGGVRTWAGPGRDVVVDDLNIECKSQQDYDGLKKLVIWIVQAMSYGPRWALAVRLGLRKHKLTFVVLPIEEHVRLLEIEREYLRERRGVSSRSDAGSSPL